MFNLLSLTKTQKLIESARIIKEELVGILKKRNIDKETLNRQLQINNNVDEFIAKTGNIDSLDDEAFVCKMLEMCSLFKNAHITLSFAKFLYKDGKMFLNQHLLYLNGKIYLVNEDNFIEVKSIGGWQTKKICNSFDRYLSYETIAWRDIQLNKMLNWVYLYKVLGIDYSKIELADGQTVHCKICENNFHNFSCLPPFKEFNLYDSNVIDDHILKIDYFACHENQEGDFEKFLEGVKDKYQSHPIDSYILDIRGNSGGNSELILPLLNFLKEKQLKGVTLTDGRVFSSGTFAAYYAKKLLNTTLIGQPLGQGSARFGQSSGKIDLCDNLFIRYTEKFFDFRDVFKKGGAINPDIEVPLKFEDICSKTDRTLDYAIHYLQTAQERNIDV